MKLSPRFWLGVLFCVSLGFDMSAQTQRHLFLDPAFLHQKEHATLAVNPPRSQEVVIRADQPWEQLMISFFLTVREEEGKLRMWYICRDKDNQPNVAYAESTDGVHWTKPHLGIVGYHGSKENNLVGLHDLEGVVFQDPNVPAAERYTYATHVFGHGIYRYHSPDGLHWQRDETPILKLGADTQMATFWDEALKKYVLYLRGWERRDDNKKYRKVLRATVDDLRQPIDIGPTDKSLYLWGKDKPPVMNDEFPTVFATDELDPPNSDVYNLPAQPYPLDPNWYVAFPSFFQRERTTSEGRLEIQFTGSRDGIHWERYDRKAYVAPGPAGSASANMVFMGAGMVVRGDGIWQYGTGFHSKHGDVAARKRQTDGVIYRYVQRVDGFVSLDFGNENGRATTAPVKVATDRMFLNVDTAALGSVRIGLLSPEGKPIPGFSVGDCEVVRTNSTHAEVVWKNQRDLHALSGKSVQVIFEGSHTKVYSFYFAESNSLKK
jgi:hypothetical protein